MYLICLSEEPPLFPAIGHIRFAQFLLLPAGDCLFLGSRVLAPGQMVSETMRSPIAIACRLQWKRKCNSLECWLLKKQKRRKSLQQVKSEVVETDMLHKGSKISWPEEVRPPISHVLKLQRVPNENALLKTSAEWNVSSIWKLSNKKQINQEFETGSLFFFIFWNCFSFPTGLCWLRERSEQVGSES